MGQPVYMTPTRRALLERIGAAAVAAAVAGCGALDGDESTGESDGDPATTRTGTPTATPTDGATATAGADSTPSPADGTGESTGEYAVDLALTRNEYRLAAHPEPREHLPIADATPLSDLNDPVRTAVETAIETDRFETDEPSTALLAGIDGLGMVADGDDYYLFSHTFTEHVLNLALGVDPETVPEDAVVDREAETVRERPSVAEAVDTVTPHGTHAPSQEYRTLTLTDELASFLDEYDYVRHAAGVGRLEYAVERQFPPYTLSARSAREEERYGRPVVDAASFAPQTQALVRETLDTYRRTPIRLDDEYRRVGALRPESVPYELERGVDRGELLRVDGSLYHFRVGHAHWDQQPMEIDATLTDGTVGSDDPAELRLSARNAGDQAVRLGVPGLLPFGILWAAPESGDGNGDTHGESVQLWSEDYERSDLVRVEDGVARPDSYRHERLVEAGETVSQTYVLGRDVDALAATDYAVWGVLWVRWPSHDDQPEHDWNADIVPYELSLAVESA